MQLPLYEPFLVVVNQSTDWQDVPVNHWVFSTVALSLNHESGLTKFVDLNYPERLVKQPSSFVEYFKTTLHSDSDFEKKKRFFLFIVIIIIIIQKEINTKLYSVRIFTQLFVIVTVSSGKMCSMHLLWERLEGKNIYYPVLCLIQLSVLI